MSKWKMVPVELTPAMVDAIDTGRTDSAGSIYYNLLAAAPKWEPSEAQIELGVQAYRAELTRIFDAVGRLEASDSHNAIRAAILAAVGGHDEH